jgi:ketosteroid isomerase-like protein
MKQPWKKTIVLTLALALIVVGCSPSATPVPPPAQGKDPESVLKAITEALNRKDAEAATALLAENVEQTLVPASSGSGIYKGKEAMRARFKEVVAGNPIHKLTNCQTSGDKVTCAATYSDDSTKPLGFDLEFTVDAIVQNGLLKTVTWAMTDASLAKMQAAMAQAAAPKPTATPQPTAIPPTEPPAPTPTSSPVETLASSIDDLVGVWWFPKIGMIEFKVDGTSRVTFHNTLVGEGTYTFDNGKVTWSDPSGTCKDKPATYEAYVARQDGKPVWLRMQVVGSDPCRDRANALSSPGKFQHP